MLDRFIWGDVERISPEAPVPVMRVMAESHGWRCGQRHTQCSFVGSSGDRLWSSDGTWRKRLVHDLRRAGASTAGIIADKQVQTSSKKPDYCPTATSTDCSLGPGESKSIAEATLKRVREFVLARAKKCDAVVISDYGKGSCMRASARDYAFG
jgi:D-beta-D-heptose 7-phosphate kinase/D-beta-D-heptose 1-phosphate adenosyltransferase